METEVLKSTPYSYYAFYSLYRHFTPHHRVAYKLKDICSKLYPSFKLDSYEKTSLFITWKKKSTSAGNDYQLRGCIGTFAKIPVDLGIERYSVVAAVEDNRFPPISSKELNTLKCTCNILQNFETIFKRGEKDGDIFNWELGKHGIELKFKHPKTHKNCSATFLPDVMTEQGWDKSDTFTNLIEKADCWAYVDEIMDHYEDYFVEVIRYEGNKSEITYDEFNEKLRILKG